MKTKIENPELFINRELSWCEFNQRVLEEAIDPTTPLLERFRFVSIVASNLDEFFMVRVAALKSLIASEDQTRCPAGLTPLETFQAVSARVHQMVNQLYVLIEQQLLPKIAQEGIVVRSFDSLNPKQSSQLEKQFQNEIFPVLTPMAVDPTHPFPALTNLSLNAGVMLAPVAPEAKERLAIVPIPTGLPRLIPLKDATHHFVLLEDLIRNFLSPLFTGQEIIEHAIFRITRDSEIELDEDASDLLDLVEKEIRRRRKNPVVRFEVEKTVGKPLLQLFSRSLEFGQEDLYLNPLFLDPRFLNSFADLAGFDHLRYLPVTPVMPKEFQQQESIWPVLREQDVCLMHPYESFEPVIGMVSEAADDPDVLAIKQTLYRTSATSPILSALERAAAKGKQVAVCVELTARFDEERNIEWARQLERAGVHVIYGLVGLKTHAKILLIVRREKRGIRRYVHLGTGNYNERTARLYTDIGLMTADDDIGVDASGFFNTITGYSDPPAFQKLAMAPVGMRERFLHLIEREKQRALAGQAAVIQAKMNSLVDPEIITALYDASRAGVRIKLAVRGICCLRPGVKSVSETITVVSIVDRFLEHSRIYYFRNGGDEEFYCSSADWMPRNLDRRVELLFPVTQQKARERLATTFDLFFADNVKARVLLPAGNYIYKKRKRNEEPIHFQEAMQKMIAGEGVTPRVPAFKPQSIPSI